MRKLALHLAAVLLSVAAPGIGSAAEPAEGAPAPAVPAAQEAAPAAGKNAVKKGDAVYVCGCGAGCKCGTIQAEPGKCGCGHDLVKAKVTKVDGDRISVKVPGAKGAWDFKAPYKCGCGGACNCTAALGPGKCACGKDLVKNE